MFNRRVNIRSMQLTVLGYPNETKRNRTKQNKKKMPSHFFRERMQAMKKHNRIHRTSYTVCNIRVDMIYRLNAKTIFVFYIGVTGV